MSYVTGFLGIESYDIILYLGRVARSLGKKALMIDYSESKALSYSITNPLVHGGEVVDLRGVDFVSFPEDFSLVESYDYVFVDFGFNFSNQCIEECDGLFLVCDQKVHNVERLKDAPVLDDQDVTFVLKDYVHSKIKPKAIFSQFDFLGISKDDCFVIEETEGNSVSRILAQYDSIFKFNKISTDFKELLKSFFNADFKSKDVSSAFTRASKAARR